MLLSVLITLLILKLTSCAPIKDKFANITVLADAEEYETRFFNVSLLSDSPNFYFISSTGEVCSNSKKTKKQYCVKVNADPVTFMDNIGAPLTACLDSRYGEGGSTSKQFSVEVDVIPGFTVGLSDTTMTAISLTAGVTVTQSVAFAITDTCDVTKGNIVQMWGYPFYTRANVKYRSFEISSIRGRRKNWSSWSEDHEVVYATKIGPATRCIGSVNEAICGQTPVKRKFTVPGNSL